MSLVRIACLVEGDGEVEALPVLLRRLVPEVDSQVAPIVPRPFRHPRGSIRKPGGFENALDAVAERYRDHAILVLIDSDDDCPKELGTELAERASQARPDLRISIVLAHREYECWFLAGAESLAGRRNLLPDLSAPPNPESIRDAKGWLGERTEGGGRYRPTQDQAALSANLDLGLARSRSRSFQKLWKEIKTLVRETAQEE